MKATPEVNVEVVQAFLKRLTRWGPLGQDVLKSLDFASEATRSLCARLAGASGYPNVARKVAGW